MVHQKPSEAESRSAEEAILASIARFPIGNPPTPRALQAAASDGRAPELMATAFWRMVQTGTLVFDGNARVKLNDIPRRER